MIEGLLLVLSHLNHDIIILTGLVCKEIDFLLNEGRGVDGRAFLFLAAHHLFLGLSHVEACGILEITDNQIDEGEG